MRTSFLLLLLTFSLSASAFYNWETEDAETQLAMDGTMIPVGMGGVFIPAMTKSADEPSGVLMSGNKQVAEIPPGKLVLVQPGDYTFVIGSGVGDQRMSRELHVSEGHSTIIDPFWAVLVLRVVNEHNFPIRGSYELIEMDKKENLGVGLGADEEKGERLQAWILQPSTYKVIKVGENYRSYRNFFTFRINKGEYHNLNLVMDEATGEFYGAGLMDESLQTKVVGDWKYFFSLSGDFLLNATQNVFGVEDHYLFSASTLFDGSIRYNRENISFFNRIETEEGFNREEGREFRKALDRVRFRSIIIYRIFPWFGPYARVGLDTNLFNQYYFFDQPTSVTIQDSEGNELDTRPDLARLETAQPFSPLTLREGVGGNFDLLNSIWLNFYLRTGIGLRQSLVHGDLFSASDTSDPQNVIFKRVGDYYLTGNELTGILNGYLLERFSYSTEFDVFFPFEDLGDPIINWISALTLRLTSFSSLNFLVDMTKDANIQEDVQFDYRLILRFTLTLL